MARGFFFAHVENVPQPVIVLRPVHQRDVARVGARSEIPPPRDAPIEPPSTCRSLLVALRVEGELALAESARLRRRPTEQLADPSRFQRRRVVAPKGVFL